METQAYFSEIREAIVQRLNAAKVSVLVTDSRIDESALKQISDQGVRVMLAPYAQ